MANKIFINFSLEFKPGAATPSSFLISFNWITTTGILAGAIDKSVTMPFIVTTASLDNAVLTTVLAAINSSGKYTVQHGDQLILMNAFDAVITH